MPLGKAKSKTETSSAKQGPARRPAARCSRSRRASSSSRPSASATSRSSVQQYYVLEDDSELTRAPTSRTRAELRPEHARADRHDRVHGQGPQARSPRYQADRPARLGDDPARRAHEARSDALPALRDHARQPDRLAARRSTSWRTRRASTAAPARRSTASATIQETQDLAENLRIGALPIELKLISKTQVSATLGKQALDQGLIAGAVGLRSDAALPAPLLPRARRGRGVALMIYAVLLFALVKLIPITLTLPGIAGLILTLGVAADANIVIFERIKEEARPGRSIPAAISAGYSKALRDDHRRERRDDRRRVHPLHARDRGRQGLRVHAGRRHASSRCSPPCSPRRRCSARWRARA